MIRVVLREAILVAVMLVAVSLVGFVLLDLTGRHDWYGTLVAAHRAGVPEEDALARDLPRVWNRRVADAHVRTLDDLADLARPSARTAAQDRLRHRGTAALPTLLAALPRLGPDARDAALVVLADMAPVITGGERPPPDAVSALAYWHRFFTLRGLDYRPAYARRIVQRLVDHPSQNAGEQLTRLGTYAFPAIFEVFDGPIDTDGARRLADVLSDLTGRSIRIRPDASVAETREVVDTWRAWWFAERLEFGTLGETWRFIGHVTETRYGRWLTRALAGRLGRSSVTDQPILAELRERAPRSVFVGGLGGLLATAFVVAFGGGAVLRRRPFGTKLLDLLGALVPGAAAFTFGFLALTALCAAPRPLAPHLRRVLTGWPSLVVAVVALTPLAILWLRRKSARVTLHAVRQDAESWARESRNPKLIQMLRHGLRVGLASLLAPISLSALPLVLMALVVEPMVGVRGMAALTVRSAVTLDAPWILVSALTLVPIWVGRRWAHRVFLWALGDPTQRPPPPQSIVPNAPVSDADEDVYQKVIAGGSLSLRSPPMIGPEGPEQPAK